MQSKLMGRRQGGRTFLLIFDWRQALAGLSFCGRERRRWHPLPRSARWNAGSWRG